MLVRYLIMPKERYMEPTNSYWTIAHQSYESSEVPPKPSFYSYSNFWFSLQPIWQIREEQKLKRNLAYAREALLYTKQAIPLGAVNIAEEANDVASRILKAEKEKLFLEMCKESYETAQVLDRRNLTELDIQRILAGIAKKYKVGNCGEQSCVAYCYLVDEKHLRKVERLSIVNGDHGFVVIGRQFGSDISNPETWGKVAVICDPWTNRYYPAHQFKERINIPGDVLYDPKIHSIGWYSNGTVPFAVKTLNVLHRLSLEQNRKKVDIAKDLVGRLDSQNQSAEAQELDLCFKKYLQSYITLKSSPKIAPQLKRNDAAHVDHEFRRYRTQLFPQSRVAERNQDAKE